MAKGKPGILSIKGKLSDLDLFRCCISSIVSGDAGIASVGSSSSTSESSASNSASLDDCVDLSPYVERNEEDGDVEIVWPLLAAPLEFGPLLFTNSERSDSSI